MAHCTCKTLISLFDSVSLNKPLISNPICFVSLSPSSTSKKRKTLISTHDYLTNHHQFSDEIALQVSSSTPYLNNPKNFDAAVLFLMENGFSKSHIEKILKQKPKIFNSKIITLKPRLQIFQDLGLTQTEIANLVAGTPWLLRSNFAPRISVLQRVLGSSAKVCKSLKISSLLLSFDLELFFVPNIEFLKSCGICSSQIERFVYFNPLLFLAKPESMRETVKRVDALGVSRESNAYLYAVQALNALPGEEWEKKVEIFRSLGFSDDQILSAFRRVSLAFVRSESKIKEIYQILLRVANVDASFILKHPEVLNYSTERRIEPRLKVYEILEGKNLFGRKPKLSTFLKLPQEKFVWRYVVPFSNELGEDVSRVFETRRLSST